METSNQVRHRLRSSWEDRTPHRSQVAAPTVLRRRRRRLSRNEPANRFACSTVASRLESKGPSGTITNLHQRPRFPVHARKIRVQARSGLAAWQQLVVAAYIEKHIAESITVHALARFVYLTSHCFSRAFKRSFGIPPHRYVIQQRIERRKHCWQVRHCRLPKSVLHSASAERVRFRRRSERSQESPQPNIA